MPNLQSIVYKDGKLKILDLLSLPESTRFIDINGVVCAFEAIHIMQVRGGPAVAIVACLGLAVELYPEKFECKKTLRHEVEGKLNYLCSSTRPTVENLRLAADSLISLAYILAQDVTTSAAAMKTRIISTIEGMLEKGISDNHLIGQAGADAILARPHKNRRLRILTHSNTGSLVTPGYGTALGIIRALHSRNRLDHVYCTETRPYNQGAQLTAYELVHDKIRGSLIGDSMVASLLKSHNIAAVVVGADRVAANGDTVNTIGTYQIAVLAKYYNVPVFVATPFAAIDLRIPNGERIVIQEHPAKVMTHIGNVRIAAKGIPCWNPAFDMTNASLITSIVTERGVYEPSQLLALRHNMEAGENVLPLS